MVISRARVTEVNKRWMDSEVTILNDKFQSYGVELVIEMSTGSSHISDKTEWQAFVCTTTQHLHSPDKKQSDVCRGS